MEESYDTSAFDVIPEGFPITRAPYIEATTGKAMYFYGGDHGETVHDGNFCMDGLVYPDRTLHTGLLEYKNVHRPVRAIFYDQHKKNLRFAATWTLRI